MLITSVTKSNIEAFDNMIPVDIWHTGNKDNYFFLGALSDADERGARKAVGTLVFRVKAGQDPETEAIVSIGEIMWLFVDKAERGKGYADGLMDKCLEILSKTDIEFVVMDVSMTEEFDVLCYYLENGGFEFHFEERAEVILPVTAFERVLPGAAQIPDYIHSVAALTERQKEQLRGILDEVSENAHALEDYDERLSCVACYGKRIDGFMLAEKLPSGMIDIRQVWNVHSNEDTLYLMLNHVIRNVVRIYRDFPTICLNCETEEMGKLIDEILPEAEPNLIRRGYLFAEEGGEN